MVYSPPGSSRLLCPCSSPGKNTEVGSYFLLQRIFPTQDRTWVSCFAGRFFTIWATREGNSVLTNHLMPTVQQEFSSSWGYKNWLLTHKNCWLPGLSGGQPSGFTVPTLYLLFVLNKNSLPSEAPCVWKFFSNPCISKIDIESDLNIILCADLYFPPST